MNKRSVFCVIIFSSLVFCVTALAQNRSGANSQNKQNPCDKFKTPVITPPADVDPKMVVKPREDIDYKMIVIDPCATSKTYCPSSPALPPRIDPCATPETKTVEIKPNIPWGQWKNNPTSPVFRLTPQTPQAPDKLKTPSEMLKEYALPARPKKDQ